MINTNGSAVAVTDQEYDESRLPLFGNRQGLTHAARMNGNANHKSGGNLAQSNIHEMIAQQHEKPYTAAEGNKRRNRGIGSDAKTGMSSKQSTNYTGGPLSGAKGFGNYATRGSSIPGMTRSVGPKHILPLRN